MRNRTGHFSKTFSLDDESTRVHVVGSLSGSLVAQHRPDVELDYAYGRVLYHVAASPRPDSCVAPPLRVPLQFPLPHCTHICIAHLHTACGAPGTATDSVK